MKRLIIFLNHVEKTDNKIFNVLNITIKNDSEINQHLALYAGNVKKHQISYFK